LKKLAWKGSVVLFGLPTLVFAVIAWILIPALNQKGLHPALSWFIGGLLIFGLLYIAALVLTRQEGYTSTRDILNRLRVKKMTGRDWKYTLVSLLIIFILTGLIMGISIFLHVRFGLPEPETTPAFMEFEPLTGSNRFLLLIWLVMFYLNIMGEELMWRGYILPRQELAFGQNAWLVNAGLWLIFHLCFGWQLMLLTTPVLFILPYAVQKTQNTTVGILLHAIVNGPAFILISLGII
jgi:membrane protease YdiL (CAAX protease family)